MVQLKLFPIVTRNLFSRNYLEERLPKLSFWESFSEHESKFEAVKYLYEKEKDELKQRNEAQLEASFIRPILRTLNHKFEVQESSDKGLLTPDYAFFPNDEVRRRALLSKGEKKEFYKDAIAIGDAKEWGTPLDRKSKGKAKYVEGNPSFQIDKYLRDTEKKWGILTDGRYWRLYYRDTSYKLDSYFEIDLKDIVEEDSKAGFKYFYLFFRKEAFVSDEKGLCFLDKVYNEGIEYATKISDALEKRIYQALKILSQGFFEWGANNLEYSNKNIKTVHDKSLIFLYRLLFVLYADSRGMLNDLHKEENRYYDITKIRARALSQYQSNNLSEYTTELWDNLSALFELIDEGSDTRKIPRERMFVPPYNGGLFHPEEHKFLADNKVGDKFVGEVLNLITVSDEEGYPGFIDYSALEIRHLGSIYEGLLEYKLKIAEENLVAIKEKGKEKWIPKTEVNGKKIIDEVTEGKLYLSTDKGERKATGSYYTPDYIVKYIVKNTLGPLVDEINKSNSSDEEKLERLLSIKVLDPAMGSGHFLVEATDFLAENVAMYVKSEELERESEIEWARREVVKRCIYGVDLNHLAVELSKLSLWLHTLESERPLSFLDHHLNVGNSLIGSDLKRLDVYPKELGQKEKQAAISDFIDVSVKDKILGLVRQHLWLTSKEENTILDIKAKEEHFDLIEKSESKRMLEELANLQTGFFFENNYSKSVYMEALDAFRKGVEAWKSERENDHFKKAQEIAEEKNFFHWKLEFPDVFYDKNGELENPGFDVVIGNPPYVSNWELTAYDNYLPFRLEKMYPTVAFGHWDLYILFSYKSIQLTKNTGFQSFIVPNAFSMEKYGAKLREHIIKNCALIQLVDFGEEHIFDDVARQYLIYVISPKFNDYDLTQIIRYQHGTFSNIAEINQKQFLDFSNYSLRTDLTKKDLMLKTKIEKSSIFLGTICCINVGVVAHSKIDSPITFKKDDVITSEKINPGCKRYIEGMDIGRYSFVWNGLYIDYETKSQFFHRPKFPELFDSSKIMIRRVSGADNKILSCFDIEGHYTNDNIMHAVKWTEKIQKLQSPKGWQINKESQNYDLRYVEAIINSKCMTYYFSNFLATDTLQSSYTGVYPEDVRKFKIRLISFTTPEDERERLVAELKDLYIKGNFDRILELVEVYLPKDKVGNFIAEREKSDVVHDLLAYLAEQMIEMNKAKQKEIKGFIGWLEEYVKMKVDDMTLKSKVREYYKPDFNWSEMQKVLTKNKGKITEFDITRREPLEKIKEEFDSSTGKLKPLLDRIKGTDRLIDQVVYKLYGLTDEEIRVVEGENQ